MKKFMEHLLEEANPKTKPEGKHTLLDKAISKVEKLVKTKKPAAKKPAEKMPEKLGAPPQSPTRVLVFGRMAPVTHGHQKVIDQAKKLAQKHGGSLISEWTRTDG